MKRFIKTDDYYLDIQTDLKWAQEDHGFMNWEKSIKTVPKGWRLPSIGELHSIISFESEPRTQLPNVNYPAAKACWASS